MTAVDELIRGLPDEYHDLATSYVNLLTDSTFEDIEGWIDLISHGKWVKAYNQLARKMTTSDLIAEQQRINIALTQLNKANAEHVDIQKAMVKEALLISLALAKAKL